MRVAVVGAGAIGALVAASAADSGHEVIVCVRTPIDSLVLEADGKTTELPVVIARQTEDVGREPADVVFVTNKVTDDAGVAPWLSVLCGQETIVASVQNGLDHESRLAPFVPAGTVAPALAYVAAERIAPGRVRYLAGERVVVPTGVQDRLSGALSGGRLVVRGVSDMRTAAWRKLLGNLVANPITALTMRRIGVMDDPGIGDLARGILLEALQVGRAEGASLADEDVEAVLEGTGQYGPETGSSMLYDRLAGRPMEHQYLTGEIVRRGEARNIAVPLNSAVLALLEAIDRGRLDRGAGTGQGA